MLVFVAFAFIIMSFKTLPLRRLLSPRSRPANSNLYARRAFSTTPACDATWGFIGLGQMGMFFISLVVYDLLLTSFHTLSRLPNGSKPTVKDSRRRHARDLRREPEHDREVPR